MGRRSLGVPGVAWGLKVAPGQLVSQVPGNPRDILSRLGTWERAGLVAFNRYRTLSVLQLPADVLRRELQLKSLPGQPVVAARAGWVRGGFQAVLAWALPGEEASDWSLPRWPFMPPGPTSALVAMAQLRLARLEHGRVRGWAIKAGTNRLLIEPVEVPAETRKLLLAMAEGSFLKWGAWDRPTPLIRPAWANKALGRAGTSLGKVLREALKTNRRDG